MDHVHHRVDQRQVREGLREVAEVPAAARVDLFRVELQRARVRKQLLAQLPRPVELADLAQRRDEPERADRERALLPLKPVVGLLGAVAKHHSVDRQLVGDREHRGSHARVLGRKEANERDQQHRGVQRLRPVVLDEDAALVDPVLADVGLDLIGDRLPAAGEVARRRASRPGARRGRARPSTSASRT